MPSTAQRESDGDRAVGPRLRGAGGAGAGAAGRRAQPPRKRDAILSARTVPRDRAQPTPREDAWCRTHLSAGANSGPGSCGCTPRITGARLIPGTSYRRGWSAYGRPAGADLALISGQRRVS